MEKVVLSMCFHLVLALGVAGGSCEQSNKPVQALLLPGEHLGLCALTHGALPVQLKEILGA